MRKYRYVGDIHGQIDLMHLALDCDADRIIFCGDLVDSFRQPFEKQIECVNFALELAENSKVDVLCGNHEWSYLHPNMQCSGFSKEIYTFIKTIREQILAKFKPFIYEEDILVTHAGLTSQLWVKHNLNKNNLVQVLTEWYEDIKSPFFDIGRARGGYASIGGPLWCDFNHEFVPIPELTQVFGHTRGKGIRQRENSYCIDTLENTAPQFLDLQFD